MSKAPEIRRRLADWLDGNTSLREFEDWFVPNTWDLHLSGDVEAEEITDEIELSLFEYSDGTRSSSELREALTRISHPLIGHNSIVGMVDRNEPIGCSGETNAGFGSSSATLRAA
jgi:hypothetical protein